MATPASVSGGHDAIDLPLRHLDEFLLLKCAPDLLTLKLGFTSAKEITESIACWSALRKHVLPVLKKWEKEEEKAAASDAVAGVIVASVAADTAKFVGIASAGQPPAAEGSGSIQNAAGRPAATAAASPYDRDAIIVVGDGTKPRTAALCSFLTGGKYACISVDPGLHYDSVSDRAFLENGRGITQVDVDRWAAVRNLTMVRARIQDISIPCRRAIVVMMHAHVTNADAIGAIDASEGTIAMVTCPCCNWEPHQRQLFGQPPNLEYSDPNLLSDKRLMRVWYQRPNTDEALDPIRVGSGMVPGGAAQHRRLKNAAPAALAAGASAAAAIDHRDNTTSGGWAPDLLRSSATTPEAATAMELDDSSSCDSGGLVPWWATAAHALEASAVAAGDSDVSAALDSSQPDGPAASSSPYAAVTSAPAASSATSSFSASTAAQAPAEGSSSSDSSSASSSSIASAARSALGINKAAGHNDLNSPFATQTPKWANLDSNTIKARIGQMRVGSHTWVRVLSGGAAGFQGNTCAPSNASASSNATAAGTPAIAPPPELWLRPSDCGSILRYLALRPGFQPLPVFLAAMRASVSDLGAGTGHDSGAHHQSTASTTSSAPSVPAAASTPVNVGIGTRMISVGVVTAVRSLKAVVFYDIHELPGLCDVEDTSGGALHTAPPSASAAADATTTSSTQAPTAVACDHPQTSPVFTPVPALLKHQPSYLWTAIETHAHDDCVAGRDRNNGVDEIVVSVSSSSSAAASSSSGSKKASVKGGATGPQSVAGGNAAAAARGNGNADADEDAGRLQVCVARPGVTCDHKDKTARTPAVNTTELAAANSNGGASVPGRLRDSEIYSPPRPSDECAGWVTGLKPGDVVLFSGTVGRGFSQRGNLLLYITHAALLYDSVARLMKGQRRQIVVK